MTKKQFIERISYHNYGKRNGFHAIYFDYASDKNYAGFKYMVSCRKEMSNKALLIKNMFDWVTQKINNLPYYIQTRYAETDEQRFKVKITM